MALFGNAHWLRDLTDKVTRRIKHLIGRPDVKPWVLRPQTPGGDNYVDFVIGIDFVNIDSKLVRMFHEAVSPLGISLLLVNKWSVERVLQRVRAGRLKPYIYLDLCSATNPNFAELLKAFADAGVQTIGDPAKLALWTWKARAQIGLEEAGMPVPPTVLIRADEPTRELTADERDAVGDKCVIKPSWGVAGLGVVANVRPTAQAIAKAREFAPTDDFLVQKMIKWEHFGTRAAYVRGYNILGTRTLLWWSPETRLYDMVTWDDLRQYDLMGALELVDRMAKLTGMEFFSSEIAITNGINQPRFVLIDYCNDQCDINPVSVQGDGPPDEWSLWTVARFAEFVWRKKAGLPENEGHAVWLSRGDELPAGKVLPGKHETPRMVSVA